MAGAGWLAQGAMQALQLWLTADQEAEISELQRMTKGLIDSYQGADKPVDAVHTDERTGERIEDPIGSAEWEEEEEWRELYPGRRRRPCRPRPKHHHHHHHGEEE